jgi:hypothetical protein
MPKHSSSILELARKGASHRYDELKAELAALIKAFPHLEFGSAISPAAPKAEFDRLRKPRTRKPMSAAAKKAVSARMKKYWAARRKQES